MSLGLTHSWWAIVIRAIAAIALGIFAFARPGITLVTLVLVFAVYAIVDGIFAMAAAANASRAGERWWGVLLEGLCGIAVGFLVLAVPGISLLFLIYLIALWAMATGVFKLVTAVQLRKVISGEWLMVFGGIASIVFGVLLLIAPAAGALALVWWIGTYALVFGASLLLLGFRMRKEQKALRA